MAKRRTRFITWAKREPNDTRRINYEFTLKNGTVVVFTSDNPCTPETVERIRKSWIDEVKLVDDEWYVKIYEGK